MNKIVERSCLVICPLRPWSKYRVYTKTIVTEDAQFFADRLIVLHRYTVFAV